MIRILSAALLSLICWSVSAETFRIATFNASLSRKGPGLLLRDIVERDDRQIAAVMQIIRTVRPDILLINEFDYDAEGRALEAFLRKLALDGNGTDGLLYPYFYAPAQNVGVPSGLDLNGDGKLGGPADAYGFGNFRGQYAMALVSRFPIEIAEVQDFAPMLWKNLPGGEMPTHKDGTPFPNFDALHQMRLSSKGHWDVPVRLPDGRVLHVLASHPTPPIFDGPEEMNGKRNRDEILFWSQYLDSSFDVDGLFVVLGDLNADPFDGNGIKSGVSGLLNHPFVQDVTPRSDGAQRAALDQGGANSRHKGNAAFDTADWPDERGPGNLRVDYVLPSKAFDVSGAGVFWPTPDQVGHNWIGSNGRLASDHRLVWVDLK